MKDKFDDLLPIGSICKLKNIDKKIIVSGYFGVDEENKTIYTYYGFIYPYGFSISDKYTSFNDEDIEDVVFIGYKDESFEFFKKGMENALKEDIE